MIIITRYNRSIILDDRTTDVSIEKMDDILITKIKGRILEGDLDALKELLERRVDSFK